MPIVLFEPQIPQNTGNIIRLCAVVGQSLILVRPLGFRMTDRYLKRAGLDYWEDVGIEIIDDLCELLEGTERPFYLFSSHATKPYTKISYSSDDLLIFGSETSGLSTEISEQYSDKLYQIPMIPGQRCLNLSNAASVVAYESWRQRDFQCGKLASPVLTTYQH